MARNRAKKYRLKRKAWIEYEMMESEAFRSLSGTAMWVLLRFMQKREWSHTRSSGRKIRVYEDSSLTFTYPEANHFGISDTTFLRSIKTLVRRGFLDVEHRGGTMGQGRDYSRFKISDRWRKWGAADFDETDFPRLRYRGMDVQTRKERKRDSEN
jgi:hypothetical protein